MYYDEDMSWQEAEVQHFADEVESDGREPWEEGFELGERGYAEI